MDNTTRHILVLRFSAMGDVALITPIVKSFKAAYPDHKITVVSRPKFSAFFPNSNNVNFFPADVDSKYSGWMGLLKLFIELKKSNPTVVIDLHDHIRSRFVSFLFRLSGKRIVRFDKGRSEKKLITRKKNKIRNEIPHTVERYKNAFIKAGFEFPILQAPFIDIDPEAEIRVNKWFKRKGLIKHEEWVGVAPFAAHKTKIWPTKNYEELFDSMIKKQRVKFFLFGGCKNELIFFEEIHNRFPVNTVIVAGELDLKSELALIKRLDKMLCVDSGNMHLASLLGIPTISIWGGTHPATGFGPVGQKNTLIQINIEKLPCRPCSVYGKETCWRGDFACLNEITPVQIQSIL